jgi:hypothetical protein
MNGHYHVDDKDTVDQSEMYVHAYDWCAPRLTGQVAGCAKH